MKEELDEEVLVQTLEVLRPEAEAGGRCLQVGHAPLLQMHEALLVRHLDSVTHTRVSDQRMNQRGVERAMDASFGARTSSASRMAADEAVSITLVRH